MGIDLTHPRRGKAPERHLPGDPAELIAAREAAEAALNAYFDDPVSRRYRANLNSPAFVKARRARLRREMTRAGIACDAARGKRRVRS